MALVLGGLYVGWKRLWPVAQIQEASDAVWDWRVNWKSYVGLEPTKFIRPAPTVGSGVTLNIEGEVHPGVTVMSSIWDGNNVGLALWSQDGKELHRWVARYSDLQRLIPPLSPELSPTNNWDTHVDAMVMYPNGDADLQCRRARPGAHGPVQQGVWWLDYETTR